MEDQAHARECVPIENRRGESLRVALVHDWLTGRRGGEKCLELLCDAFPSATVYTLLHVPNSVGPVIEQHPIKTSPLQRIPEVERRYRSLLPIMPLAARSWNVGNVDLVISLSHCVAKSVRVPRGIPHICYCFTPMRYAWDGRDAYLDRWARRPLARAAATFLLNRLRAWDRSSARGVTHFVAISQTIKDRIARCYGRDSHVIYPPVDTTFYTPDLAVAREPFDLCVSALVPYKRIDHAVEACARLGRKLVVIGEGPERPALERIAAPDTVFLGWQSDAVIRDHLRRCRALLFPADEDFGIVPVEALACGTPVVALGRGGASETIDARCGHLYNSQTVEGLAGALAEWDRASGRFDARWARARAETFSRSNFSRRMRDQVAKVMREAAQAGPPAPHFNSPTPSLRWRHLRRSAALSPRREPDGRIGPSAFDSIDHA